MPGSHYDLLVVGGGINGAGIARDAAGRGLSVALVEAGDLAGATSSASSKLLHGGLRYLEQREFRLVAEALAEREVLLRVAAHLASPMRFVLPHLPGERPRWLVRLGLFLYDHLARRSVLPGTQAVRLDAPPLRGSLRADLRHGFSYFDCRVDDARLVVANAVDAATRGARVLVGTALLSARAERGGWQAWLSNGEQLSAGALVNATGPWAQQVLNERLGRPSADTLRLVKGSHIVLPRLYEGDHAFLLQNDDRRVVFLIPFEGRFTLVGTTDEPWDGPAGEVAASQAEVRYLCRAVARYAAREVREAQVRWRFAGLRPLHDDGAADPSRISRDYSLRLDGGGAPLLTVFGGKITTYRILAERALEMLAPYLPAAGGAWTGTAPLPGSDWESRGDAFRALSARYRDIAPEILHAVFGRHGALAVQVLGDGELGEHFGAGLTEREVRWFVEHEWARSAEDVLWRRSKAGLHLDAAAAARVARAVGA